MHDAFAHSASMRPQDLIEALRLQRGLSVGRLAELMHNRNFQGTLHRYLKSDTTAPEHSTAERIAKFFDLPLEAIYDARVAARIARERGLQVPPATAPIAHVAEEVKVYEVKRPARQFPASMMAHIAGLSDPQFQSLVEMMTVFLNGIAPEAAHTKQGAS